MLAKKILVAATALALLAGCASPPASPQEQAETTPAATVEPTPAPTPELVALDPTDFATQIDFFGPGVDFDSADGNVHCGIWHERGSFFLDISGPYAGCRASEADYETDPAAWNEVECGGGAIVGDQPAHPVCDSGQAFVGEDPSQYTVGLLNPGESIVYAGFMCTSPDSSTITCTRVSDGAGFVVARTEYRYF